MSMLLKSYSISKWGDNILVDDSGNPAAVITTKPDGSHYTIGGQQYDIAVATASKRAGMAWCTSGCAVYQGSVVPATPPGYNIKPHTLATINSSTTDAYITQGLHTNYTPTQLTDVVYNYNSNTDAAHYCRSIIGADGIPFDMPTCEVLAFIYRDRQFIEEADPTVGDYPTYSLTNNWGFGSNGVLTIEDYATCALAIMRNDDLGYFDWIKNNYVEKTDHYGIIPIRLIPVA